MNNEEEDWNAEWARAKHEIRYKSAKNRLKSLMGDAPIEVVGPSHKNLPEETIVTSMRVSDAEDLDHPAVDGSEKVPCFKCGELVWLAPSSPRGYRVACAQCVAQLAREEAEKDGS